MRIIINICRLLVGSLFIISGLIKSNDVIGFMYKLEEYFEPGALNLEWLAPYALPLAVFIVIGEILLGVALLVGALPKLTSTLTLILMLFFTWLTYYTDNCDPMGTKTIINEQGVTEEIPNQCVLECGCFGNAIPLTPHESFLKDVVLLIFVLPIFFGAFRGLVSLNTTKESIYMYTLSILMTAIFAMTMLNWMFPPLFTALLLLVASFIQRRVKGEAKQYMMAVGALLVCGVFQYSTLAYLPMKDYRPYAVGENIRKNMMSAEELGLEPPRYATEYTFRSKATGQDTVILSTDYSEIYNKEWFKNGYEEVSWDGPSVKVSDGYEAPIKDFEVLDYEGVDHTYDIVEDPGYVFLHISHTLEKTEESVQGALNELAAKAADANASFYAITNAGYDVAEDYRHKHQAAYPFYVCDQTELKIIIRSNPGLVLLKGGVVIEKWAWREIPTWEEAKELMP